MNTRSVVLGGGMILMLLGAVWMVAESVEVDRRDPALDGARTTSSEVTQSDTSPSSSDIGGARTSLASDGAPDEGMNAPEQGTTVEEALSEYWGPDWPSVRARLLEAGKDLSRPFSFCDRAEAELRLAEEVRISEDERSQYEDELVDWPEEFTEEWVRANCGFLSPISPELLSECEAAAAAFTPELRRLVSVFTEELDRALQTEWTFAREHMVPYSTTSLPPDELGESGAAFHACAHGWRGWAVKVKLHAQRYPEAYASYQAILDERRERERTLVALIRERTGH